MNAPSASPWNVVGADQQLREVYTFTAMLAMALILSSATKFRPVNDLEHDLRNVIRGDVRFDAGSRLLYSLSRDWFVSSNGLTGQGGTLS
jgi:hypothetical protein